MSEVSRVLVNGVLLILLEAFALMGKDLVDRRHPFGWWMIFIKYPVFAYVLIALGYYAAVFPLAVWLIVDIKRCRKWWAYWMDPSPF